MKGSKLEPTELLWSEEFWSHPGLPLSQHLSAVGEACKSFFYQAGIRDGSLIRLAELIGKAHDFGKYTPFFQAYVRQRDKELYQQFIKGSKLGQRPVKELRINPELKEHSPISALFSTWLIRRELKDDFFVLAGFICILKHHGNLNKDPDDLLDWLEDNFGNESGSEFSQDRYGKQIEFLRRNLRRISAEMEKIGINETERFIDELPHTYSYLRKLLFDLTRKEKIEEAWKKFFILLLLFSSLVDADRRDAAQLKEWGKRKTLNPNLVDNYRENKFKILRKPLDPLRNKVYEDTVNSLDFSKWTSFKNCTITAPTGIGKTLLAFSIALKLRESIREDTGVTPRIVYVLPYINIIEQTYGVFSEVLDDEKPISPYLLLKHHHQHFLEESREEIPLDEALLLQEAWDSEVVVTTFVQFFHSLVGGHRHFLRKFHNMFNSIIILDEAQTIPMEYWDLLKKSVEEFSRNSNSLVIVMTATRPVIFGDWIEFVPNHRKIFQVLDRVRYTYLGDEMEVKDLAEWFMSEIWSKKPGSALVVLNTIESSIQLYQLIKKKLKDKVVGLGEADEEKKIGDISRMVMAYLSTNIMPAERKRRIERIKKLLEEERKIIVVSTQVVEAGVDLDFNVVTRDLGPVDSIIQVGGRCNRSDREPGKGDIYVVRVTEGGKELAPKIYGNLSTNHARQILEEHPKFHEKDILTITNKYFERTFRSKSGQKSEDFLKAIESFDFNKISEFKLIEEEPKESVFIELNEEARETLEKFEEALKKVEVAKRENDLKKVFECKAELKKKRTELENWIVTIWNGQKSRLPLCVVSGTKNALIWHVRKTEVDKYYDGETGYKLSSRAAVI